VGLGNFYLDVFDVSVFKLYHLTTIDTNEMIVVVIGVLQLKNGSTIGK
jgi:hypothetical protein